MIHRRLLLIPLAAGMSLAAQVPPPAPAPPVPPAVPESPAPPVPPLAPLPPAPPATNWDFDFDFDFNFNGDWSKFADLGTKIGAKVNERVEAQMAQLNAKLGNMALFQRRTLGNSADDRLYESGQNALDRGQWTNALSNFTEVANHAGSRADGALYWKAYTLNKLGRRDEALAAIADLRKTYASSRWLDDAGALEIEVKQASGRAVSPEAEADGELKLMALNALVNSDPDRALPLLENLLKSSQSPRVKERALFVLGQSNVPRARQLLEQVAKGNGNPDLQLKAIQYLGTVGRKQGANQTLYDIYTASSDTAVKRAVLRAMLTSGDTDHIQQAARSEKSPELRVEAIRLLGAKSETSDWLVSLYNSDQEANVRRAVLDSLMSQRNAKALIELARKEKDADTKKEIVRRLTAINSKEANDYFMELLK